MISFFAEVDKSVLYGAITMLAGVIGYMFKLFYASKQKTEAKLDECEEDRIKLHEKLGGLNKRVAGLESKVGLDDVGGK